ncbi:alpha/beta fold hydrolase [Uliginosibacterium sp. H3]|uniref:Alpha/beta fold hydrolase n=1 Tax=Uliginosibacterium silvisoli TaxID=3114758 RepID=A0ABU6K288_9RHOO|nr:alpha/beta fold hydrolase [Uliginosibacterium sp. H3]
MARKPGWLNAWKVLSQAATRSTVRTQKKVGKAMSKAVAEALAETTTRQIRQARQTTRQALNGVVSPAPPPISRGSGQWLEGRWGLGPLAQRSYCLFVPDAASKSRPVSLLVLLHGCGQDAASFAASTHAARVARSANCMILLPEQSSQANAQRCWNWFRSDLRVAAEAGLLMSIIEHVCSQQAVLQERVYLLGMSAGGSMALTLALRFPQRFAAVVSHSGAVPHSARNAVQASQAMHGHRGPDVQALRLALAGRQAPPLLLIHGETDRTVVPDNALASVALWLELFPHAAHARPAPGHGRDIRRGTRRPYNVVDWKLAGQPCIRLIRVAGLAHAWSGGHAKQAFSDPAGPDALKLALRFFDECPHYASSSPAGKRRGQGPAPILRTG